MFNFQFRELETENERIRRFYVKKIESIESKSASQISTLQDQIEDLSSKNTVGDCDSPYKQNVNGDDNSDELPSTSTGLFNGSNKHIDGVSSVDRHQIPNNALHFLDRITELENELQRVKLQQQTQQVELISSVRRVQAGAESGKHKSETAVSMEEKGCDTRDLNSHAPAPYNESNNTSLPPNEEELEEKRKLWMQYKEEEKKNYLLSIELEYVKKQLDSVQQSPIHSQLSVCFTITFCISWV